MRAVSCFTCDSRGVDWNAQNSCQFTYGSLPVAYVQLLGGCTAGHCVRTNLYSFICVYIARYYLRDWRHWLTDFCFAYVKMYIGVLVTRVSRAMRHSCTSCCILLRAVSVFTLIRVLLLSEEPRSASRIICKLIKLSAELKVFDSREGELFLFANESRSFRDRTVRSF